MDDALYREEILDHYYSSPYRGTIERPDLHAALNNPLCGDHVEMDLELSPEGTIRRARFHGDGCAISQAAASLLAGDIEGKSTAEARRLSAEDMLRLMGVPLTPARRKCGLLAFRVLQLALLGAPDP
jgi:nitrogen fixation NifU-like protein